VRQRILAPIAALILAVAGAATAAAAAGVFESNDSGVDTPHDVLERATGVTTSTPSPSLPAASLPTTTLPDDDDPAEREAEDEQVVNLAAGATQTFAAGNAGSVSVRRDGDSLAVLAVTANPGFASEVEQASGTEIEVLPAPAPATRLDNSGPGSVNSGPGDVNDDQRGTSRTTTASKLATTTRDPVLRDPVLRDRTVRDPVTRDRVTSGSGGSGSGHSGSGGGEG
jgi:hypothetical protein